MISQKGDYQRDIVWDKYWNFRFCSQMHHVNTKNTGAALRYGLGDLNSNQLLPEKIQPLEKGKRCTAILLLK